MIRFPSSHNKNSRFSPSVGFVRLDQERSFLLRIVGHAMKKNMSPNATDEPFPKKEEQEWTRRSW